MANDLYAGTCCFYSAFRTIADIEGFGSERHRFRQIENAPCEVRFFFS